MGGQGRGAEGQEVEKGCPISYELCSPSPVCVLEVGDGSLISAALLLVKSSLLYAIFVPKHHHVVLLHTNEPMASIYSLSFEY